MAEPLTKGGYMIISKRITYIIIIFAVIFLPTDALLGSSQKESAKYFSLSIKANNQATFLQNGNGSLSEIMEYRKKAYDYSTIVRRDDLNKRLIGLGDKYVTLFKTGLKLQIEGYSAADNKKLLKGQLLVSQWGQWLMEHIDDIRNKK